MTDVELQLNAWTDNKGASVFAVQGEQESRTLHVTLIDRDGESEPYSSAPKDPRYIDLTGYTARLYVVKSDSTKVYFPGEITDAENGKVDFTLTGQCVAAPGKAVCTIVLTKEDVELKVVGIVLDVRENDLEGSIESSDEWVELDVMLTKAQEAVEACETATDAANSAASSAETKISEMDQLKGDLETAEAARVTAEQGRESAEVARQDAEQQRQTESAEAVSAANTAASSANAAADRANKAAEAIEGTDVGDLAVRVQTLEGEMDTVNDTIDGLNVPQMQQSITQLEDEIGTAQQDITTLKDQAITGATVTVDSNVGTPSASVSISDGTMAFAFRNLKGEKGDKGDKGDRGATGPQGPAGEMTVLNLVPLFRISGSLASYVELISVIQYGRIISIVGRFKRMPDGWITTQDQLRIYNFGNPDWYSPIQETPLQVGSTNTGTTTGEVNLSYSGTSFYGCVRGVSNADVTWRLFYVMKQDFGS